MQTKIRQCDCIMICIQASGGGGLRCVLFGAVCCGPEELMRNLMNSEKLRTSQIQRTAPWFLSSFRRIKHSLRSSATRPPTLSTSQLEICPNTFDASPRAKVKFSLPTFRPQNSATLRTRHRGAVVCQISSTAVWRISSPLWNMLGRLAWIWSAAMGLYGDASPSMLRLWEIIQNSCWSR